jgi:hypothetical protein
MGLHGRWKMVRNDQWSVCSRRYSSRSGARKDYAGGLIDENGFYLKNCGFFSNMVNLDQQFTRPPTGLQPTVDFAQLPY